MSPHENKEIQKYSNLAKRRSRVAVVVDMTNDSMHIIKVLVVIQSMSNLPDHKERRGTLPMLHFAEEMNHSAKCFHCPKNPAEILTRLGMKEGCMPLKARNLQSF